jgi:hypothetical protein
MAPDLIVGAVFIVLASLGYRRRGMPPLVAATLIASTVLLVWGLSQHAKYPADETIELPIFVALVPPLISGTALVLLAKAKAPLWASFVCGALAWGLSFFGTMIAGLYLNWVTI